MAKASVRRALGAAAKLSESAETDGELLRRYTADDDQEAFAALVRRHANLVSGVCRRALSSATDAEDATQAVFVVLARRAAGGRWQPSIANWLYATARKVSRDARVAAQRRTRREGKAGKPEAVPPVDLMTGRELLAALDDELDRLPAIYREPLVLCYLEGLGRDDAAVRLGVPAGTVKTRLERGRKKLADALTKRGVALGSGLLALAATSPAGASPPRLLDSILAAAGGSPSASVAALARGVAVSTWKSKAILAVTAVVAASVLGVGMRSTEVGATDKPALKAEKGDEPKPAAKVEAKAGTVTGTVVGPDGKPVAGAVIRTEKEPDFMQSLVRLVTGKPGITELATTDADGQFAVKLDPLPAGRPDYRFLVAAKPGFGPDWVKVGDIAGAIKLTLVADDVPLKGRVTDLEGKPVPKAKVSVRSIATTPTGDLSKVWEEWPRSPYLALREASKSMWTPALAGLPESVTADADGRFEIAGVGRGRLVALGFEAKGIETAACRVVSDLAFDPKKVEQPNEKTMPGGGFQPGPALYGPTFTHAAKPSQPVTGTVTDSQTGKLIAGVQVNGHDDGPHWYENGAQGVMTDAAGKFTLTGIAKTNRVRLSVFPNIKAPYFHYATTLAGKPGLTEITADLKLTRGVLLKGRVVDNATGQPIRGAGIRYTALADNKHYADLMKGKSGESGMAYNSDADGRFEFVVLPGSGIVMAQGETRGRNAGTEFTQVRIATADLARADMRHLENLGEAFSAADGHIITMHSLSGYKLVEPKLGDDVAEVEIGFDRGKTVTGKVLTPDGKPAAGVTAYKLTACYDYPQKLTAGTFTAIALDHPRTLLFADAAKKLATTVTLKGDEKDLVLKLEPWGKLTGRLLDADGQPVAGASVSASTKESVKYMAFNNVLSERKAVTDVDGTFALDVPGGPAAYLVGFSLKNKYLNTGYDPKAPGYTVKAGETTDAGEFKAKAD